MWFKHYNTASEGNTLSLLWSNSDYEAIALWWRVLELISKWEKEEERGRVLLSWLLLARETNWKPSKCRRVLARISSVSQIELREEQNGNFSLLLPNWMELQETRGGKRAAKKEQKVDRGKKREERGKNKEQNAQSANHPLAEIWNLNRGKLPAVKGLGKKRIESADARWNENPSTEYWTEIVCRMARSSFCRGDKNDPAGKHANWKSDFDFLVRPETHIRVSEGKYDDRIPTQIEKKSYNLDDLKAMKL